MRFSVAWQQQGVPFTALSPLLLGVGDERLYVVGGEAGHRHVAACSVDVSGRWSDAFPLAPLGSVSGVLVDRDALVAGGRGENGEPRVLAVAPDGGRLWSCSLPTRRPTSHWPRLFPVEPGRVGIAWIEADTLRLAQIRAGSIERLNSVPLGASTAAWDLVAVPGGVLIARSVTHSGSIDVLHMRSGSLDGHQTLAAPAVRHAGMDVQAAGARCALTWIDSESDELWLQWLAGDGTPDGDARLVLSAEPGTALSAARCVWSGDSRAAVIWQTLRLGDAPSTRGDRPGAASVQPVRSFREQIAPIDAESLEVGTARSIDDPGATFDGGAWLGGVLVVLHGAQVPSLTAFRAPDQRAS